MIYSTDARTNHLIEQAENLPADGLRDWYANLTDEGRDLFVSWARDFANTAKAVMTKLSRAARESAQTLTQWWASMPPEIRAYYEEESRKTEEA